MSIFFDFDENVDRKWFRKAIDADKYEIDLFWKRSETEKVFGEVNVGELIELSVLAICMLNEHNRVVGFMALSDYPNVPCVDPADWEIWARNLYQRYYLSRNTLFIHFMCCEDDVADTFFEKALSTVFYNDFYLLQILLVVPPHCTSDEFARYKTFRRRAMYKHHARKGNEIDESHFIYAAQRKDYCQKLKIRCAVEEDNDDIVAILDTMCPKMKELYGDYYISEIVGQHSESQRKVIVAEFQEKAVGVMCLNTQIDYQMLNDMYELKPHYGLRKATVLEKEQEKRTNSLLKAFGDPIMLGKWGPFDTVADLSSIHLVDPGVLRTKIENKKLSKGSGRISFSRNAAMRRSFDHLYFNNQSDDYSEMFSPTPSQATIRSFTGVYLEADSFDYDIVNIDDKLLTIPEVKPSNHKKVEPNSKRSRSKYAELKKKRIQKKNLLRTTNSEDSERKQYLGEGNAFMIELFALRDDLDERQAYDILEAAFEIMKSYDYCLIRIPCSLKSFPLLQHFCFIPSKSDICTEYALYISHRNSVLGKLRVRKAEFIDVPQIATLLHNMDGKETLWTIENSILGRKQHEAYVLMSGTSLIGFGILEPPEQINFIRAKFNMDTYYNHKYHLKGQGVGSGFSTLKIVQVYPVFEVHYRFFAREMMRLSGASNLIWLTAYRNKWVIHKSNCLVTAMVPLLPRKSEIDCVSVPALKKITTLSNNLMAFSTWFISKRLTSVIKLNIDTRIVIVGASRTAMAFLNTLLFSDSSSYLTFTNVTLVSPCGLPAVHHCKSATEMMFPRYRTDSNKFLKSVPYTYYVNVVHGTMVDINKQEKYITLASGQKCYYDQLFLMYGKQYQHPDYLKQILGREKNMHDASAPKYVRLDRPLYGDVPITNDFETPNNVFIVNNVIEANKALTYVSRFFWQNKDYNILVYGASIHAYCCVTALLELGVPAENIVFIESFPPEESRKTRVTVFGNVYVDQTVIEILEDLQVTVYREYYFQSWTMDSYKNVITRVDFLSHYNMIRLDCSALFYYGTRGVDADAFMAIHRSGMAYDGGIVIDHEFRTKDPSVYAAGPVTKYRRLYFADSRRQKYYDSYEVGEKLGIQIRKQLDPILSRNGSSNRTSARSYKSVSEDFSDEKHTGDESGSSVTNESQDSCSERVKKLPVLVKPLVTYCILPKNLQYLEVRSPGMKIPHHYVQSLDYNGYVMETFKEGYFKIHLNKDFIVDGITCLSPTRYPIENFKNIFGLSALVLNNVHVKYTTKKIDNLYAFFRSPWAFFLYHENVDELLAMAKELLPLGHPNGNTLLDSLRSANEHHNSSFCEDVKFFIRSKFKHSAHVEAITAYVIEWLSENDVTLPMYLQPCQVKDYNYDVNANNLIKKKKRRVVTMMNLSC